MNKTDLKMKRFEGFLYSPIRNNIYEEVEKDIKKITGENIVVEKIGSDLKVKMLEENKTYILKTKEQGSTLCPIFKPDVLVYKVEIY